LLLQRDRLLPPASTTSLGACGAVQAPHPGATGFDPVQLELFQHRFTAIAEQRGELLRQTASSVNIKERLDFACALFDGRGGLVANAPHIPVHLGSMGDSVVSLLAAVARGERPPLGPGDAVAANNPYNGGTHLPDITVITPVFAAPPPGSEPATSAAVVPTAQVPAVEPAATQSLFFVTSRGHHGDVGGLTPGSMPPFSQSIDEEGLLLDNAILLAEGHFDGPGWRERLAAGPWPVRDPDRLLADLQAQLATNQLGATELQALGDAAVRRVIDRLQDGSHRINLDDGSQLPVEYLGIRRGSGGEGRWRGGDGLIRELRFLEPLTIALISGSRLQAPEGLEGGGPGAAGLNLLIPPYGDPEMLPGCIERQLGRGSLADRNPGGWRLRAPSGHPLSDAG